MPPGFNDARLVLLGPWGRAADFAALAVAATIIGLAIRGYRREPRGRRALLVGLRALAVGCALVLFFQPARELRHLLSQPNHIAVLVDTSASMAVAESPGGQTRAARAAEILQQNHDTFERWRDEHKVDFYTFGDGLEPAAEATLESPPPPIAAGAELPGARSTQLREALADLRSRYDGEDLAGVVVVSDGIDNGRLAAEAGSAETHDFLGALDAKVHTVWAARPGIKDVAIERVVASDFAFVHTVVKIDAVVRVAGYEAQDIPVTLSQNGQVVKVKTVHVDPTAPEAAAPRVEFEFTPDRVGKLIYQLSVPVLPGEAVVENNRLEFVLRVIRDKVRVLQVAGRPSPDERFLRALLKRDPNVDLISFFILRSPENMAALVPQDELSLIPFPTDELFGRQLPSFDLIILQNFNYIPYGMAQYLGGMRDYVIGGGGLAMIGGDLSFAEGDYQGTPIADILPVTMPESAGSGGFDPDQFDQTDPGGDLGAPTGLGSRSSALISTDAFHIQLTDAGERFPITALALDRAGNDAAWGSLPMLSGCNLLSGAQTGAVVLGVHPTLKGDDGQPMPVLAVADEGKGRALALASDSSWRWGFGGGGSDGAAGAPGHAYQTFWENSFRWLIHDPDFDLVHVETDESEYAPGASVHVTVRVLDAAYRPSPAHPLSVTIAKAEPGDTAEVLSRALKTDDAGQAALDFAPPTSGAYRITAHADVAGHDAVGEEVLLVRDEGKELSVVAGREDLLRGVSDATGGTYLGSETDLSPLTFAPPRVIAIDRKQDLELWSHPLMFFIAVGLLAAEWLLRRRHGYV